MTTQREIKFRVLSVGGQWFYFTLDDLVCGEAAEGLPCIKPETWVQYTGLKDKNGVEIYEGDICTLRNRNVVVVFHNGGFRLKNKRTDKALGAGCLHLKINVIGNIYENPELLEDL